MLSPVARSYAAFCACALIWGSTFLVIRIGNDSLPALWAATIRLLLAGVILTTWLYASGERFPRGEALKAAFWYGFYEFGVSFPLLYWGEKTMPSGLAAVLYATIPVTAMLMARAFGLEKLSLPRLGAAALAVFGVAIIFWRELSTGVEASAFIAVLAAAIAAPLAGMMLKRGPSQSPLGSNAIGAFVGAPICLLFSVLTGETIRMPSGWGQWWPILYLTVAGSVGAFVLFAWLINRWKASSVSFMAVIIPVIAVVLGALARGERLAPGSAIGAVIVIAGTIFVLRSEWTTGSA